MELEELEEAGADGEGGDDDVREEDWENQMGPEGRTKFDEYYEARKAKIKKRAQILRRNDW